MKAVLLIVVGLLATQPAFSESDQAAIKISARPINSGRVNPMLFGNFMELLDDLVPSMWAEMLNDRSFEGITKPANWSYYDGALNICDREWQKTHAVVDGENPFNGAHSVKLTASKSDPASIAQFDLATKQGTACKFSGYLRAGNSKVEVKIILKTKLPNGDWLELAAKRIPNLSRDWKKFSAELRPNGTTDRAVFELKVTGAGNVWADKLSLMPAENLAGWRNDVIEAIRETKPSIIRWGGSVCDPGGYRWKEGIGNRDLRKPFPNKVWGRIDSNDVGIDEFCDFCRLVGAEPLVCLSFSDGPQSAADLVEYCNGSANSIWGAKRAAHGHATAYKIKYWQIGNEISGDDENYLRDFQNFCDAMKKMDANATILASFPSQKLLAKAGKEISYIGPHHYTPDFAACENDFKNLSGMIQKTPGCAHIKIAVTEWNVSAGSWGLMRGKFLTLETALLNARYLNLLMRHADLVEIACRSNMANSMGSGIIEMTPSGLLKRPSFYVMQLYAQHAKPIPLLVEKLPDGLDVFACASENKKSLSIFAVNMKSEPVTVSLDLGEFSNSLRASSGETVCDTLDARQPDAMNHWNSPERITTTKLAATGNKIIFPAFSASHIECNAP